MSSSRKEDHLFPQIVVPLAAVHGLLCLFGELFFDAEDVEFLCQQAIEHGEAARGIALLQQKLTVLDAQMHILGEVVGHITGLGICQQIDDLLGDHVVIILNILLKLRKAASHQRFLPLGAHALGLVLPGRHIGKISLGITVHALGLRAVEALNHHTADAAPRLAELLTDAADRADGIDFILLRHIGAQILLRGEEDELVRAHSVIQRGDGGRPLHIKGEQHAGKHMQASQSQQRHFDGLLFNLCHGFSLSGVYPYACSSS